MLLLLYYCCSIEEECCIVQNSVARGSEHTPGHLNPLAFPSVKYQMFIYSAA